ncbi:MAG: tyrosine-type recombinase/integrase [Oscillospiraceae bacterium]
MTIKQLYDMFLLEQQYRNNTSKTINWYNENLFNFFTWLDSDDISELTLENFKLYGVHLRTEVFKRNGAQLSSTSVQCALRAVKAFYNFCIEEDHLPDFSKKLRLPKAHSKEKMILDDDEIKKLLSCMEQQNMCLRNKCFVTLMLDSGLRRGEVPKLDISDVDFKNKILLVKGKGCKQRVVPLGAMSCTLLQKYYDERQSKQYVSSSSPFFLDVNGNRCSDNLMKQVFQDLKKLSGIERLHPHLLRHTFATYYLADGGDLETLRLILGHGDIQTTQTYLHLAFNLKLARSRHNSHLDKLDFDVL